MFTPPEINAMRDLLSLWSSERVVLIGASALGCFMDMSWRRTADLDLSLSVSIEESCARIARLPGWSKHPRQEQRWQAPGDIAVDLIPADTTLLEKGSLVWPTSGFEMSLLGVRLTFEHATPVRVSKELTIRAAPVPVIAVLKAVAYLDRPTDRERDLQDIAHILEDWIGAGDPRRFSDQILDLDLAFEDVSPFILGQNIGRVLIDKEKDALDVFLNRIQDPADPNGTLARITSLGPAAWRDDPQTTLDRFAALRRGIAAGRP